TFMGFVPRSGSEREEWFERVASEPGTVVFFEVPHRVERTVNDLRFQLVERQILWFKELSKFHEYSGLSPTIDARSDLGEYVGVVGPAESLKSVEIDADQAASIVGRLTEHIGLEHSKAVEVTASILGADARAVRK